MVTEPAQTREGPRRLVALAVLLVLAAALIVGGVALWSVPAALIVAGVLVGVIGMAFLVEIPAPGPGREES